MPFREPSQPQIQDYPEDLLFSSLGDGRLSLQLCIRPPPNLNSKLIPPSWCPFFFFLLCLRNNEMS